MLYKKVERSLNKIISFWDFLIDFDICEWCLPFRIHASKKETNSIHRASYCDVNDLLAVLIWLNSFLIDEHLPQRLKIMHSKGLFAVADSNDIGIFIRI